MSTNIDKKEASSETQEKKSDDPQEAKSGGDKSATRQSDEKRLETTTLYIGRLAPRLTRLHLEKLFRKFGNVIRLDIKNNRTDWNYCFCQFHTVEEAQKCLSQLDGQVLLQRKLIVRPANDKGPQTFQPTVTRINSQNATTPQAIRKQQRDLDDKIQKLKRKISASQSKKDES